MPAGSAVVFQVFLKKWYEWVIGISLPAGYNDYV